MKIAVVIDRLNVGGVEKIAIEEVIALRKLKHDAQLVVLSRKAVVEGAFPDLVSQIPITYLEDRLPKFLRTARKFPIFNFFSVFHITYPFLLPWKIKRNEFDYIVCHGTYTCFTAVGIRKIKKIPFGAFIWDPIDYILDKAYAGKFPQLVSWLLHKVARFLDRLIVRNAQSILVGGDAHNAYFAKIAKTPIVVISPSVHPLAVLPKHKEDYMVVVTAWKPGKSPEYVFEILKKVPKLRIKMVGKWLNPDHQTAFQAEVDKLGYTKNIDVVGGVSEEQLATYFSQALFTLQINDDRGFGMPALEAAGRGTTFIIPQGQGVCALFNDPEDGFYVKEKDTAQITKKIAWLLDEPSRGHEMGRHAWEKVIKNYSWEEHAKKIVALV